MKLIASYVCYGLGHAVAKVMWWRWQYRIYNRLMIWSSDLDVNGRIWKEVE